MPQRGCQQLRSRPSHTEHKPSLTPTHHFLPPTYHLVSDGVHEQLQTRGAQHALAAHRARLVQLLPPLAPQEVDDVALIKVGDPEGRGEGIG